MKRSTFLMIAGILALFFGLSMIVSPDMMLANATTLHPEMGAHNVMRWLGSGLVAIGIINILSRNDPGSPALKAVMLGNIVLHVVAEALDVQDHAAGVVTQQGLIMGTVVHVLIAAGFAFYIWKRPSASA